MRVCACSVKQKKGVRNTFKCRVVRQLKEVWNVEVEDLKDGDNIAKLRDAANFIDKVEFMLGVENTFNNKSQSIGTTTTPTTEH